MPGGLGVIFPKALIPGRLLRRYKRFLADVVLENNQQVTVHCPNTGAMLGCQAPGSRVWLSESDNPRRKYRHTWEIVETGAGVRVGINTMRSNQLVAEAIGEGLPGSLSAYSALRREVAVSDGRLDFLLSGQPGQPDCFVEVKNVTASVQNGVALFPDAKSPRAVRHLDSLLEMKASGFRAALIFCVQRDDVHSVEAAAEIDPAFSAALGAASAGGVEIYALGASVAPQGIRLETSLDVVAPQL